MKKIIIRNEPIPHYYSNKKYIGDAWWSNDEEIIEDICKMSMISFLKKYKGF